MNLQIVLGLHLKNKLTIGENEWVLANRMKVIEELKEYVA